MSFTFSLRVATFELPPFNTPIDHAAESGELTVDRHLVTICQSFLLVLLEREWVNLPQHLVAE